MKNYIPASLELHLFFSRIMKEHALFLEAGFVAADKDWAQKAGCFYTKFENILREVVELSDGTASEAIICSGEIVTQFTVDAERKTSRLTGAAVDSNITLLEKQLQAGCPPCCTQQMRRCISQLNQRVLKVLCELIEFKEKILKEVSCCRLFTANYPLLIQHIIREAKLYRNYLMELEKTGTICERNMREMEIFWNRIMMEHALFIRGLLDPTENRLIDTADEFAKEYECLLKEASQRNCETIGTLTEKTIEETKKYRAFKCAGTEGILDCKIASLILPLLADHVLREANHYLRILQEPDKRRV